MQRGVKSWQRKLAKWLDEWRLAWSGIILATGNYRFILVFLLSFIIFGTLMNLLSGSTAAVSLFWSVDFAGKLRIIWDGFLGIFGIGRNFWDWALLCGVTFLQSILIGVVALVWQKRRRNRQSQIAADAANAENLQNAGLAAGLAVLGSGCPTCGTTLLAPVLGALFSTSSYALASIVSGFLTTAAIIVALLSLKRLGNNAYALIISEKYQRRPSSARPTTTNSKQESK